MSQVNTKTVLLGSNADQSKNFKITVPSPEDGTLTIERADGTDVMKFLANGGVDMPSLPFLKNVNGYVTLPNGLIVQWANAVILTDSDGYGAVALQLPFPNAKFVDFFGWGDATSPTSFLFGSVADTTPLTVSKFRCFEGSSGNPAVSATVRVFVVAIGY